jgi:hypothetical protein
LAAGADRHGGIKRAQNPDIAEENGVQIASLLDLLASKLKTVQLRAEAKDYQDIVARGESSIRGLLREFLEDFSSRTIDALWIGKIFVHDPVECINQFFFRVHPARPS